jgi:hypothetical protein
LQRPLLSEERRAVAGSRIERNKKNTWEEFYEFCTFKSRGLRGS